MPMDYLSSFTVPIIVVFFGWMKWPWPTYRNKSFQGHGNGKMYVLYNYVLYNYVLYNYVLYKLIIIFRNICRLYLQKCTWWRITKNVYTFFRTNFRCHNTCIYSIDIDLFHPANVRQRGHSSVVVGNCVLFIDSKPFTGGWIDGYSTN